MVKKVSGYIRFATAKRAEVLAKYPNATFGEVGSKLGAMWRALSAAEKAKYSSRSKSTPKSKSTKKTSKKKSAKKNSKPKKSTKKTSKKNSKPKKATKKKSSKSASPKPRRRSASPGFKAFAASKRKEKGYSKASLQTIKTAWKDLDQGEKVLFTAMAKVSKKGAKKGAKKSKPKK